MDDEINVGRRHLVVSRLIDLLFDHVHGFVHRDIVEWNAENGHGPTLQMRHHVHSEDHVWLLRGTGIQKGRASLQSVPRSPGFRLVGSPRQLAW